MIDLIKRTMLTGLGLAVMTKDKVEELGRDLAEQAKLGESEGREFVDNLMKQSETARNEFETRVNALVKKAVEGLNLVHKDEVAKLQGRIDALEDELKKHEHASSHHAAASHHGV
ncbi:phasin family protein [Paludisphaera rhizosphaerae]|uniref:phasin family protein n=1 Tax=Paludisphaera rhizosphaerae TaxID=2711216 RepID=UPI0013EA9C8D|nr:phasin superfamily protein [Paludisphaera rhizosphaerae]